MARYSRKDYNLTAESIRSLSNERDRERLTQQYTEIYGADNPRFNRSRFIAACQPQKG